MDILSSAIWYLLSDMSPITSYEDMVIVCGSHGHHVMRKGVPCCHLNQFSKVAATKIIVRLHEYLPQPALTCKAMLAWLPIQGVGPQYETPPIIQASTGDTAQMELPPEVGLPMGLVVLTNGVGCTYQWGWLYLPMGLVVLTNGVGCTYQWGWLYLPMGLVVLTNGVGCTYRWGWLYLPMGLYLVLNLSNRWNMLRSCNSDVTVM